MTRGCDRPDRETDAPGRTQDRVREMRHPFGRSVQAAVLTAHTFAFLFGHFDVRASCKTEEDVTAAFVVLAVFSGLSMFIGTVAAAILVANGKLTLPNTNMRRLQQARNTVEIARAQLDQERIRMTIDAQIDLRLQRALTKGE